MYNVLRSNGYIEAVVLNWHG